MHYVLVAYPEISPADFELIQNIRKTNDKQFTIIEPHFTIVFPTAKLSESEFLEHIKSLETHTKPFAFTLTKAVVEENIYPKYFQVHLVAASPVPEIVKLHDIYYADTLASELRSDITYTPHITIASNEDEKVMQKLANDINDMNIEISGQIKEIVAISFDGKHVKKIKQLPLK